MKARQEYFCHFVYSYERGEKTTVMKNVTLCTLIAAVLGKDYFQDV